MHYPIDTFNIICPYLSNADVSTLTLLSTSVKAICSMYLDPTVNGNQAIIDACTRDDVQLVKHLLTYPQVDPDVNEGECLLIACTQDTPELVDVLLNHPGVVTLITKPSTICVSAYHRALLNGREAVIDRLLNPPGPPPHKEDVFLTYKPFEFINYLWSDSYYSSETCKILIKHPTISICSIYSSMFGSPIDLQEIAIHEYPTELGLIAIEQPKVLCSPNLLGELELTDIYYLFHCSLTIPNHEFTDKVLKELNTQEYLVGLLDIVAHHEGGHIISVIDRLLDNDLQFYFNCYSPNEVVLKRLLQDRRGSITHWCLLDMILKSELSTIDAVLSCSWIYIGTYDYCSIALEWNDKEVLVRLLQDERMRSNFNKGELLDL